MGTKNGTSTAGLLCDKRKAFYSVLPEEVLGPLLCADERAALLRAVGFNDQPIGDFNDILAASGGALAEAGLPEDLLCALNEWHTMTWYTVEDQDTYQVHSLGVKPGDSLADLIFYCCVARLHKRLASALEEAGLAVVNHVEAPSLQPPPPFSPSSFHPPSWRAWCFAGLPCSLQDTGHARAWCFAELRWPFSPLSLALFPSTRLLSTTTFSSL